MSEAKRVTTPQFKSFPNACHCSCNPFCGCACHKTAVVTPPERAEQFYRNNIKQFWNCDDEMTWGFAEAYARERVQLARKQQEEGIIEHFPSAVEDGCVCGVCEAVRSKLAESERERERLKEDLTCVGLGDLQVLRERAEAAELLNQKLREALQQVCTKFRQHFGDGDWTKHWRDALDALAAAERLLASEPERKEGTGGK